MYMKKVYIILALLLLSSNAALADEGMWMIHAINKALEKNMKARGCKLAAGEIYNSDAEDATISDAIVSLDFACTGSIISDEGLLITNHHCAYSDVHSISTNEKNYLEDGFWAMTRKEERNIPGKSVLFLKSVIDVTEQTNALIEQMKKEGKNYGMRKISHLMEQKYKKDGMEAYFSSMWSGVKYYIAYYKVYTDIRLVAAPPVSIAAFGGDIDNWEWPQHKCDFAMYRIYTAPDGSPAKYAENNIPFVPEKKLNISLKGYKPGDYTMVIGYPGRTDRYSPAADIRFNENIKLPISNHIRGIQMQMIKESFANPEIKLKYSDKFFNLSNIQELNEGMLQCFKRFKVYEEKVALEKELQEWIDASPERKAKWGNLIKDLNEKYLAVEDAEKDINYYRETLVRGCQFGQTASKIYNLRWEILKSLGVKASRAVDEVSQEEMHIRETFRFKGADYHSISNLLLRIYDDIDLDLEKRLYGYAVKTYLQNVNFEMLSAFQKEMYKRFSNSEGVCDYDALSDWMWENSYLTDESRLKEFINQEHCLNDYFADPIYRFYQEIRIISFNQKIEEIEGEPDIFSLKKEYTHALYQMREEKGIPQYPNANSTMRLTYGQVGEIHPYDAVTCSYRSTSNGILEKYKPKDLDYGLDDKQLSLLTTKDWGRWAEGENMNVNFLCDCDITGGNSGSPVLNAKGELIGLAFDGNKESLASDASYTPGYNKCVCVDIRYILWVLDKYAGMDRILDEIL